jgi:hypothetical protein
LPARSDSTVLARRVARVSGFLASSTQRTHSLRWLKASPSNVAWAAWWKAWYQNSRWARGGEDPVPDAGQRGRDDQGADQVGPVPGDGLGDPAADVVAGQDDGPQRQFADQADEAAGLGRGAVLGRRVGPVLVGLAEPAQVGHDHVGAWCQPRDDVAVVGPVSRPAVQQEHRGARPGPVVGQPESVDRCFLAHTGHYLQARDMKTGPDTSTCPTRFQAEAAPNYDSRLPSSELRLLRRPWRNVTSMSYT